MKPQVAQQSTIGKGDALEALIYDLFKAEIDADRLWVKKENCKVFLKKGYYSKDRDKDIIFDVSIELYLPGSSEYSALILIECKNYRHPVPVDDAEEFYAKVQQVGAANSKAVIASTATFQSGARSYAKSKGMGLLRYFDSTNFKWELKRSLSATAHSITSSENLSLEKALVDPSFCSSAFDLYFQSPDRLTNSLWDFLEDLVTSSALEGAAIQQLANSPSKLTNRVRFCEKNDLEDSSAIALSSIGYTTGKVNLERLCATEELRTGLRVLTNLPAPSPGVLGKIEFDPLVINIYIDEAQNNGRERFTLAHELAHHFLRHGEYLKAEVCDERDFDLKENPTLEGSDITRLEFQANYFASSLLMPRSNFIADFKQLAKDLSLVDRGFGALYLDHQPGNVRSFQIVTGHLMQAYGVSREAVKIRLESLGLLNDCRTGPRPVRNILSRAKSIFSRSKNR